MPPGMREEPGGASCSASGAIGGREAIPGANRWCCGMEVSAVKDEVTLESFRPTILAAERMRVQRGLAQKFAEEMRVFD